MKKVLILTLVMVVCCSAVQGGVIVYTPQLEFTVCHDNPTHVTNSHFSMLYDSDNEAYFVVHYTGIPEYPLPGNIDLESPHSGSPWGTINTGEILSGSIGVCAEDMYGTIWPIGTYYGHLYADFDSGDEVDIPITTKVVNCNTPAPEFPSLFIPLIMIIGFVGAVLLIKGFGKLR